MWKHNLGIDEATFEFNMINNGSARPIREIPGCKMLPHIVYNRNYEYFVKVVAFFVPITFIIFY